MAVTLCTSRNCMKIGHGSNSGIIWRLYDGFHQKKICTRMMEDYPNIVPGCIGCPRRKSLIVRRFPEAP